MNFDFDKLVIPLASSMVGLIPVLINITVGFLDKKSQMARRNNELNYVNQRVTFLMSWYQLQKEVGKPDQMSGIKDMVSQELKDVYEDLADALVESDRLLQQRHELLERYRNMGGFRKFFLLYTPYNVGGWLYHTLFYMTLTPWLVLLGYEIYQYTQTQVWFENELYLYACIGLTVLVTLFRIFGRGAAKSTEQRLATLERKTIPLGKSVSSSAAS
jgi:hypothetical protein